MTTQTRLDFAPETKPVPTDPNVQEEARPRLTGQAHAIYTMLQNGPRTETELRATTGSKRVAARVYDIKRWMRWAGFRETVKSKTDANGCCTYWLSEDA